MTAYVFGSGLGSLIIDKQLAEALRGRGYVVEEADTCAHCAQPIVTVTLAGVAVWTHDRDDRVIPYMTSPNGPRLCAGDRGLMATPKE